MKTVVIRETTALIMRPNFPSSLSVASHVKPNTHQQRERANIDSKTENNIWHAHARYYATVTFSQVILSTSEADRAAARTLMDVYFQLFREVVSERQSERADNVASEELKDETMENKKPKLNKGKDKDACGTSGFAEVQDSNARLVSAILTGINRALPYAQFRGADSECAIFHLARLILTDTVISN
jgi:ribosome biogenesis protein MAK21